MIRPHLEYAVSVWNPHHQSLIEKLEKIRKRATKLVINIKKITLRRKVTTTEDTYFEIWKDKRIEILLNCIRSLRKSMMTTQLNG